MTLFRLDASILPATSSSREIADIVEQQWTARHPDDEVIRRHVGSQPLPAEAWADAVTAGFTPEDQRTEGQQRAVALAAELARSSPPPTPSCWPCRSTTSASPST